MPSHSEALWDLVPDVPHEGKSESTARRQTTQLEPEQLLFMKKLAKNAL